MTDRENKGIVAIKMLNEVLCHKDIYKEQNSNYINILYSESNDI